MKKNESKSVEMVRRIRDEHHKLLKSKTNDEIKAFYHQKSKIVDEKLRKLLDKIQVEREAEQT